MIIGWLCIVEREYIGDGEGTFIFLVQCCVSFYSFGTKCFSLVAENTGLLNGTTNVHGFSVAK